MGSSLVFAGTLMATVEGNADPTLKPTSADQLRNWGWLVRTTRLLICKITIYLAFPSNLENSKVKIIVGIFLTVKCRPRGSWIEVWTYHSGSR